MVWTMAPGWVGSCPAHPLGPTLALHFHRLPRTESRLSDTIAIAGRSDVGKIRRRNEDSYAVFPDLGIAVVADGMGGHPGGDVASKIAAENAAEAIDDEVR